MTGPMDRDPVDLFGELGKLAARLTSFCDFATGRMAALTGEQWAWLDGDDP